MSRYLIEHVGFAMPGCAGLRPSTHTPADSSCTVGETSLRPSAPRQKPNFSAASAPESVQVGPAISYAIGQGATMVSALWGLLVWKEFAGAGSSVWLLVVLMLLLFVCGLGFNLDRPVVRAGVTARYRNITQYVPADETDLGA